MCRYVFFLSEDFKRCSCSQCWDHRETVWHPRIETSACHWVGASHCLLATISWFWQQIPQSLGFTGNCGNRGLQCKAIWFWCLGGETMKQGLHSCQTHINHFQMQISSSPEWVLHCWFSKSIANPQLYIASIEHMLSCLFLKEICVLQRRGCVSFCWPLRLLFKRTFKLERLSSMA